MGHASSGIDRARRVRELAAGRSRTASMPDPHPDRALPEDEFARIRRVVRRVVGRRSDSDDILQEVLIEVVYRPPPHSPNFEAWIRKVAQNLAARRSRSERARSRRERLVAEKRREPTPPELLDELSSSAALRERIQALGTRYASVLLLRYVDELSIAEIARRLGRREGTVRAQIMRGLRRLRHGVRARAARPNRAPRKRDEPTARSVEAAEDAR